MLKNRFYVGEIAYRGEIHKGEHAPILDRDLFDAVQVRLAEGAVKRKLTRARSSSMLVGLIFDDRGNPMSPSHANKKGVRYRYYVSHALLQNRKGEAGTVSRVSAPDIEQLICDALRKSLNVNDGASDRDLVRARIERIIIGSDRIAITLREPELEADLSDAEIAPNELPELMIPFVPKRAPQKGISHAPTDQETIDSETRETLLKAIARSRGWMETILSDQTASFENIAADEGLAERHVRRLAVLAFLSPKVIQAIADGATPSGVTVSSMTQALPHAWADQERMLGLS
jgi:hypothetical protein